MKVFGTHEERILLNGRLILRTGEVPKAVSHAFDTSKGGGYKEVAEDIKQTYEGVSRENANIELKCLDIQQKTKPVFDNKAPLIPITASKVKERHQIDIVVMTKYPVKKRNSVYKYVLAVLDCYSGYLWLRPLTTKTSSEVFYTLDHIDGLF